MDENGLQYFRMAQELNKKYWDSLNNKKLHFRGNRGSFSLISLDHETPEQGIGGFTDKEKGESFLIETIDSLLEEKRKKVAVGDSRPTREKELQAWIINYSINNGYQLPFSSGLTFLTSELAFTKTEKIVNDILALDQAGNLVVIELKSSRDKATLQRQVEKFYRTIEGNKEFFKELVTLLSPGSAWNGQMRGMIVWPDSKLWPHENGQPRTDWKHGIEEIRYKEKLEKVDGKDQRKIYYIEKDKIEFI